MAPQPHVIREREPIIDPNTVATYIGGFFFLNMIFGFVAFLLSVPFIILAAELPARWRTARHLTALTGIVVTLVGTAAIAGYFLIPSHHFREDHARGDRQTFWDMHGEELMYARIESADNPYRIATEQIVAAERRWYAERTALLIAALLTGTYTGYAVYARERSRSTPPLPPSPLAVTI